MSDLSRNDETAILTVTFEQQSAITIATVHIDQSYVDAIYQEALTKQKKDVHIQGFSHGAAPLAYIEKTYKIPLIEHLKQFFFSNCVFDFLIQQIMHHKITLLGEPRLLSAHVDSQSPAKFIFEAHTVSPSLHREWHLLPFRTPGRKNYRDLDKQVEVFIEEETKQVSDSSRSDASRSDSSHSEKKRIPCTNGIGIADWVCFSIKALSSTHGKPLLGSHNNIAWFKIGDEETDDEARQLFLNKNVGDTFVTNAHFLQDYINNTFDSPYQFQVTILSHLDCGRFCFESFKRHFKLKTVHDTHAKLIEVFSYRHDLSQRRETVEAALKALLKSHQVNIPDHIINHQKKMIIDLVQLNPDYYVYKTQQDFKEKINLLAKKQLKELALIDTIAYQENIHITQDDIVGYLNLTKRPRTKEFIYFDLPTTKVYGQEVPLPDALVRQQCLREKTLNYVINRLAKK